MNDSLPKWLQVSLFNLLLVSGIGVILRYKIAFSLPWIDQQFLLHGHSHFAFTGWVSQVLMCLLVQFLTENGLPVAFQKYRWLLYGNLFTGYGMLVSFPLEGYALFSIIFSTASIFVSYVFAWVYIKDLKRLPVQQSISSWFVSALLFNVLSSLGAFALAFMLASGRGNEHLYLGAVYFFLHFQYNGWFFFACMGLFSYQLIKAGGSDQQIKKVFRLFLLACVPAYGLSVLWLSIPGWIYGLVVAAVFMQLYGWMKLLLTAGPYIPAFRKVISQNTWYLFVLVALALSIKLVLQALSVIPSLNKLAFGFRPVVIGYLHLVLLGVISLFILAYIFSRKYLALTRTGVYGLAVFVTGIILNEIFLMGEGTGDLFNRPLSHTPLLLLGAAVILFSGLLIINLSLYRAGYASAHKLISADE